ncbi:MAG: LamG domain-containing protein [Prolixibacteraceae bacterium]|nr:LamG domain-containing protein [Prolixibacteraceae bacterium]
MDHKLMFFLLGTALLFSQCVSENIEEKYAYNQPVNQPVGEVAWFPLNGNLNDSTGNQTLISVAGPISYSAGLSSEFGQGLELDGVNNYIVISPGFTDTIAVLFWLKAGSNNGIVNPNQPVMFDYGYNAATATLVDATSEATNLVIKQNDTEFSTANMGEEDYLNTYTKYSLFYFEAGGTKASFSFQGYLIDGSPHKVSNSYELPATFNPMTDLLYIGRSSDPKSTANTFFNGCIDEIHVFNRFLSSDELNYYLTIQSE